MVPIQDLLHRMQWDADFAKADFRVGYYDRVEKRVVRVPFRRLRFEKGQHFLFEAVQNDGSVHSVPLHRIREVWRNGELIWARTGGAR